MSGAVAALAAYRSRVPYLGFLGVRFDLHGSSLTGVLPHRDTAIGNPVPPRLHGGVTAAFLEITSVAELGLALLWAGYDGAGMPPMPKTIDLTVDYLRPGLPQEAYAIARVDRSGRRYASVHVEAWQEDRSRLFAQATGHFLMPSAHG